MIVVVGLSHKTAPIEIREQAALSPEAVSELLQELVRHEAVTEALIVSTCNRVEVVASGPADAAGGLGAVADAVTIALAERAPGIESHLYSHLGAAGIKHLFRVASSLDSLVIGEPQILGQIKSAFDQARKLGTIGTHLNRVFPQTLKAAKRVRTETSVGAGQVSVPSVAIDLARQIFGELKGRRAALIGSGQMGESVAKLLAAAGAELVVVGRNEERVASLVAELGGQPRALKNLELTLVEADVIVSTTSARHFVVTHEALSVVRRNRRGRSLFLIDLAVPRDIEPKVEEIDNMFLYNVDDLSQIVSDTLSSRKKEADKAESIVAHVAHSYERALSAEQVTPAILSLREQFGGIMRTELERSLRSRLKHLSAQDRDALLRMLDSTLNKMLHPASLHLRQIASDEERQSEVDASVQLLTELFELEVTSSPQRSEGPAALRAPGEDSVMAGRDDDQAKVS